MTAIVNTHFKQAGLYGIWYRANFNNSASRITIYSNGIAKPTDLFTTPFNFSTYSSYLLLQYTCGASTWTQSGLTMQFSTVPSAVTASNTGTASWGAITYGNSGTINYCIVGDVTVNSGNGMIYLSTLDIVSGNSYSILECAVSIS